MKRYIVKKPIILGASNQHFVIGQELPAEIDDETIRQLFDSDSISSVEEIAVESETKEEDAKVQSARRKKGVKNG